MRALVRMIFTPDGAFNEGGCYAVKILMDSSVSLIIAEERRAQILEIVERLTIDASFRDKFMKPFAVQEKLHDLIRIDLKLPITEEIAFLYVRWDLLIALFSLIGQIEEGNCYAVAVTSNLFGQHYDILLDLLIEALQKGSFTFEGIEIPILPLLESRRRYEKDFNLRLSPESAVRLTGFSIARETLGVESEYKPSSEKLPFEVVMEAQFQKEKTYAKEVFLSLKYNLLQQTLLGILQFISLNSTKENKSGETSFISWKKYIVKKINQIVLKKFNGGVYSPGFRDFLSRFYTVWERKLWLVDYRSWKQSFESGRVVFDFHSQGLNAEGNLSDYEPLMKVRRLCFLKEGELHPLDRISDFTKYLSSLVDEFPTDDIPLIECLRIEKFQTYLLSQYVAEEIAKIVKEQNGTQVHFGWERYYESDSFFLVQRGGDAGLITLWEPLSSRFSSSAALFTSTSVVDFVTQLCRKLKTFREQKPSFFARLDPQVLMTTPGHAFNLNPLRFEKLWSLEEPNTAIQRFLNEPSEVLRKKRPSHEMKMRILRLAFGEESTVIANKISKQRVGIERFRQEVLDVLDKNYHETFDLALNRVLTEVSFNSFIRELPNIAIRLGFTLSPSSQRIISEFLVQKNNGKARLSTAALTILFHEALVNSDILYFPHHLIEEAICSHFRLPQVIDLGNLNWTMELREEMVYSRFVLKSDIAKNHLILCERREGVDTPLSMRFIRDLMTSTELYFET